MGATYTHTKKFIFRCQLYESHKIKEFKNINVVREINQVLYLLSENAKKYHMLYMHNQLQSYFLLNHLNCSREQRTLLKNLKTKLLDSSRTSDLQRSNREGSLKKKNVFFWALKIPNNILADSQPVQGAQSPPETRLLHLDIFISKNVKLLLFRCFICQHTFIKKFLFHLHIINVHQVFFKNKVFLKCSQKLCTVRALNLLNVYHATSSPSSLNVCDAREIGIAVTFKKGIENI